MENLPDTALDAICTALEDKSFELTVEDGAAVIQAYDQARAAGYKPDRFTAAVVLVLRRQIQESAEAVEDDTDSDSDTGGSFTGDLYWGCCPKDRGTGTVRNV